MCRAEVAINPEIIDESHPVEESPIHWVVSNTSRHLQTLRFPRIA